MKTIVIISLILVTFFVLFGCLQTSNNNNLKNNPQAQTCNESGSICLRFFNDPLSYGEKTTFEAVYTNLSEDKTVVANVNSNNLNFTNDSFSANVKSGEKWNFLFEATPKTNTSMTDSACVTTILGSEQFGSNRETFCRQITIVSK